MLRGLAKKALDMALRDHFVVLMEQDGFETTVDGMKVDCIIRPGHPDLYPIPKEKKLNPDFPANLHGPYKLLVDELTEKYMAMNKQKVIGSVEELKAKLTEEHT